MPPGGPSTSRGTTPGVTGRTVAIMTCSRRLLLPLLAALLASCGLFDLAPAADPTTGSSPTVAPSFGEVPSNGDVPAYTTTDCEGASEAFSLLCEVHDLIQAEHVDPPTASELAEAAAESLASEGPVRPLDDGELTCALPTDAYRSLCDAIALTGGPLDETVESAVDGMVRAALDPYSDYQDAIDKALAEEQRTGTVEGIGALVTTEREPPSDDPEAEPCTVLGDDCRMVIVSVFDGSPAQRAGLQPGDAIVSVDGEAVDGASLDEIVSLVRGPAGTEVALGVLRDGEVEQYEITRAAIDLEIVETATPRPGVAYLRLNIFSNNSDELVEEALRELLGDDPDTLVFDLRDDPGGSLDAAVEIASEFLDEGLVLRTETADDETTYEVRRGGLATGQSPRVIVLINEGSASASEVVAGALQEAGRAILVGEPTFGKNTVQNTFNLDNGGALKLTIARWVTPSGHDFGEVGIEPDVREELPPDLSVEELVDRALDAADRAGATASS